MAWRGSWHSLGVVCIASSFAGGAACNSTSASSGPGGGIRGAEAVHAPSDGAAASRAVSSTNDDGNQVGTRPPETGVPVRVATWNLEWLNSEPGAGVRPREAEDHARLAAYATRLDADIVAVQEVDGEEALDDVFPKEAYSHYVTRGTDPQRVGFAWKKSLTVVANADYDPIALESLRSAADVTVSVGGYSLRLLSVHLKSGCSDDALDSRSKACRKFAQQLPQLEAWIDARATEGVAFAVLGDFNRKFFRRPDEASWLSLDDGEPRAAALWSPTEAARSRCWDDARPDFIDHLLFGADLHRFVRSNSFSELVYDRSDAPHRARLSDHCAVSVVVELPRIPAHVEVPAVSSVSGAPSARTLPLPSATSSSATATTAPTSANIPPIKGNIRNGRKLYHLPSCPSYRDVVIDETKGERTFPSESEARAAGFAKAGNCR